MAFTSSRDVSFHGRRLLAHPGSGARSTSVGHRSVQYRNVAEWAASSSKAATPGASSREILAGSVERVTFHNEGNGFADLKVTTRGRRDLVTVVGHVASLTPAYAITIHKSQGSEYMAVVVPLTQHYTMLAQPQP
jgi:hypothetical protein